MAGSEQLLNDDNKLKIVRSFWNHDLQEELLCDYTLYLSFYKKEFFRHQWRSPAKLEAVMEETISSQDDILAIAQLFSRHRGSGILELQKKARDLFPLYSDGQIRNAIHFLLRVWLSLNVRVGPLLTSHTPLPRWDDNGGVLEKFVQDQFPTSNWTVSPSECRLHTNFTVAYMARACSLNIEWTKFICDHLYLDEEKKTLHIYHLKLCAHDHMSGSGACLNNSPILPKRMLQETIWTLNLLFPHRDIPTIAFLESKEQTFNSDPIPDQRRPKDLNDYIYWRERLFHLRRLYAAEPETFKEFWYKHQGYGARFQTLTTILLGFLLALILGIISSVTAIISTRATLKGLVISEEGLRIAQKAFELQKQVPICPCSS